jgi:hypothetical protein
MGPSSPRISYAMASHRQRPVRSCMEPVYPAHLLAAMSEPRDRLVSRHLPGGRRDRRPMGRRGRPGAPEPSESPRAHRRPSHRGLIAWHIWAASEELDSGVVPALTAAHGAVLALLDWLAADLRPAAVGRRIRWGGVVTRGAGEPIASRAQFRAQSTRGSHASQQQRGVSPPGSATEKEAARWPHRSSNQSEPVTATKTRR